MVAGYALSSRLFTRHEVSLNFLIYSVFIYDDINYYYTNSNTVQITFIYAQLYENCSDCLNAR